MKKIVICTFLIAAAGAVSVLNLSNNTTISEPTFALKTVSAITLGYDKSMSEKTIKAAVIDSYFRELVANGKIIRWNECIRTRTVCFTRRKRMERISLCSDTGIRIRHRQQSI